MWKHLVVVWEVGIFERVTSSGLKIVCIRILYRPVNASPFSVLVIRYGMLDADL